MKAYLFNKSNGLFEGETFEEDAMLNHEDGLTAVPPPDYELGQVPVFDRITRTWSVLPIAIVRQLMNQSGTDKENQP